MPILVETGPNRLRLEYPLVVNEADGSVLVYVPAGEFEMGDGQENNCPKHQVSLDAYYIEEVNAEFGIRTPIICTPEELMEVGA